MIVRSKVLESRSLTPSSHVIRIEKAPGFVFEPVQFCGLELATAEGNLEYPMSLACSPTREYLEFGARVSDSPWKKAFAALRRGDEVEIDGGYGHFLLDAQRDAVFVAGGIGITPLKGMAEYLVDTASPRRSILLYSNRTQEEIAYRGELDTLASAGPGFRVVHTLTREPPSSGWTGRRGRIDPILLRESADSLEHPTFYLCGGWSLVMETGRLLLAQGVPRERIVFEVFRGYQ